MERAKSYVRKGGSIILLAFVSVLVHGFWSSCAVEEDFFGSSNILATFRLTTPTAMDGKITIAEAYLKLDRIEVSGSLDGKNNTSLTHPIPPEEPPYKLTQADSSQVNFSVTSRAYDQLDLHLFPFMDTYELVYLSGTEEGPAPVDEPAEGEGTDNGEDTEDKDQGGHDGDSGDEDSDGDADNGDGDTDDGGDDAEDNDEEGNDDSDDNDDKDEDSGDKKDKDHKKKKDKDKDKHDDDEEDRDNDDDDDEEDRDDDDDDGDDEKSRNGGNNALVDLDHFFQNAKPGLVVFGIYENNGKIINLILAVTDVEKLMVRGKQDDNFSILLAENNTAQVTFDPEYWFQSLTPADVENAMVQIYQQQNVLFIHPAHNTALYQALVSRLEGSTDLQISKPGPENF